MSTTCAQPTVLDPEYPIRCAEHQGRIAAAAKDDAEKSCYYKKLSREHLAFMDAYAAEVLRRKVASRG